MSVYRTAPPSVEAPLIRRWGLAALCVAGWWLLNKVPIPGIPHDLLAQLPPRGDAVEPASSIVLGGSSIAFLATLRGLLALALDGREELRIRRWRRRVLALFLFGSALQGFSIAMWVESVSRGVGTYFVSDPGWGFRLAIAVYAAAGAAAQWFLASTISRTRVAHGPLVLLIVASLGPLVHNLTDIGVRIAVGIDTPLHSLLSATDYLAVLALLVAFAFRAPTAWPARFVRGTAFLSPLDVVLFTAVAASSVQQKMEFIARIVVPLTTDTTWSLLREIEFVGRFDGNSFPLVDIAAQVVTAAAMMLWLRKTTPTRRMPGALVWALALVIGMLAVVGIGAHAAVRPPRSLGYDGV